MPNFEARPPWRSPAQRCSSALLEHERPGGFKPIALLRCAVLFRAVACLFSGYTGFTVHSGFRVHSGSRVADIDKQVITLIHLL